MTFGGLLFYTDVAKNNNANILLTVQEVYITNENTSEYGALRGQAMTKKIDFGYNAFGLPVKLVNTFAVQCL